jgi:hypothetical protein
MATHRIPILGFNTVPDSSGNVFIEPYPVKASNDRWDHLVVVYNDTSTDLSLFGLFEVPQNYVGTAAIVVVWTATATSGNVRWQFNYRTVGGDDTTSLDQAGTEESVEANDVAPGAAHRRMTATLSLTSANLAAGETVEFDLTREGSDTGNDTMAAAAILHGVYFQYADA